jgi:hypothetical protein
MLAVTNFSFEPRLTNAASSANGHDLRRADIEDDGSGMLWTSIGALGVAMQLSRCLHLNTAQHFIDTSAKNRLINEKSTILC